MHIHYMPPTWAEDRELLRREPYWEFLSRPDSGKSVQGWATAERMIKDMDAAGIDRVVLQGEYFFAHESAVRRNNQVLDILARWPDRVLAFAAIQPKAGPAALDELKRCLDHGMRGVGEISAYAQGYTLDDPDFLRMAEKCIEYEIPLLLHANEEVGRFYRGKATTPLAHYYQLASRYPELKLVLAHWGGGLFFYEIMPEVRKTLRNVWYDTAAAPLLYPTATVFAIALQCLSPHKVLYASDYPLLLYPRRQQEPDFRPFIREIEQAGLDAQVLENVMGNNAGRLLGLIPIDEPIADQAPRPAKPQPVPPAASGGGKITDNMSVSWVAHTWPVTREIFERYHIPWQETTVPFWEPIVQSAVARGLGPDERRRLIDELIKATQ